MIEKQFKVIKISKEVFDRYTLRAGSYLINDEWLETAGGGELVSTTLLRREAVSKAHFRKCATHYLCVVACMSEWLPFKEGSDVEVLESEWAIIDSIV